MKKVLSSFLILAMVLMLISPGLAASNEATIYLGPKDALKIVSNQLADFTSSDFKNANIAKNQKSILQSKLEAINLSIDHGDYTKAKASLDQDLKVYIKNNINSSSCSKVFESIDNTIISLENASKTIISTNFGKVSGSDAGNNCWAWLGIPYAKPPVGELRWKAPQDTEVWDNTRCSTTTYSPSVQPALTKYWAGLHNVTGSEDCLYLNVFRPKNSGNNLPVYFWIHGGANTQGDSISYNEISSLSEKANIVVVVIQYRLGPFGWFNHPSLKTSATQEEKSGNFGTLDTIKALKWVKSNISTFGGNPENITVAGESAGGFNTLNLIISPLAKGLFHKAIIESAGGVNVPVAVGIEKSNIVIDKLLVADGTCKNIVEAAAHRILMSNEKIEDYLRSKSAEEIEKAVMNDKGLVNITSPFIDGNVIPGEIEAVLKSGNYNHVPLIIGNNEYEAKSFLPLLLSDIPTSTGYKWSNAYNVLGIASPTMSIEEFMPENGPDREVYNACGKYPSLFWKATMVDSLARAMKSHNDKVYCYWYKWGNEGSGSYPFNFLVGAGHAFEISFFQGWTKDVWDTNVAFTKENEVGRKALQKSMMSYETAFIATGNPNSNGSGLPVWKEWSNQSNDAKSIIFNADFNNAKINMSTQEVALYDVVTQMNNLPESIKEKVKQLINIFLNQPI